MKIIKTAINFVKGMIDNLLILFELIYVSYKAADIYQISYWKALSRGFSLARNHHFRAHEGLNLGLFNSEIKNDALINYISKRRLSQEQARINPESWFWVTESKDVFYRFCMMMDIVTPKLYALYYKKSSGWTADNTSPHQIDDWVDYVKDKLPETFVIKPARGVYGHGFDIYKRKGNCFVDTDGNSFSPWSFINVMLANQKYDAFVFQERLVNHPDLTNLSASEYLQSLRVNSFVDKYGACRIVYTILKLITGTSISDNFHGGITGNLVVNVDVESGLLSDPLGLTENKAGFCPPSNHSNIINSIDGFRMPFWKETCACIKDAALKFLPIRSIGWDVAVTPEGPVIIEANTRWDPLPNMYAGMDDIVRSMREE